MVSPAEGRNRNPACLPSLAQVAGELIRQVLVKDSARRIEYLNFMAEARISPGE